MVAGSPDDEGNSVEVVRKLARRLPVYWLVGDEPSSLTWLVSDANAHAAVRCLRRDTLPAYWAYLTARYVFFTHGLYGSVHPPAHKTYVNLWHGDGPKVRKGFTTARSTFVVSGTRLWGRQRARSFGVGERGLLVTGNPRIDQFTRPAHDDGLRALGIDPTRPLVLWLPTYRTTEYRLKRIGVARNWSDGEELSRSAAVTAMLKAVAKDAESLGVTLAVKPHHLDADTYGTTGFHLITGSALRAVRVGLYQLLARADGLITDYSSVWTDFLALDRPIGFYCPDLDDYIVSRGLNVDDYPALLPGPMLETRADFHAFLRGCVDEPESGPACRARTVQTIGAQTKPGATERLLDALPIPR
ncbi:CDP-glycerol glycerophosphotransferase family protein [soil metagenome]